MSNDGQGYVSGRRRVVSLVPVQTRRNEAYAENESRNMKKILTQRPPLACEYLHFIPFYMIPKHGRHGVFPCRVGGTGLGEFMDNVVLADVFGAVGDEGCGGDGCVGEGDWQRLGLCRGLGLRLRLHLR